MAEEPSHPAFSPDGKRIYYNVNSGPWTTLHVAEREGPVVAPVASSNCAEEWGAPLGEEEIGGECSERSGGLHGKDPHRRLRVPAKRRDNEEQDDGQLRGHEDLKGAGEERTAGRRGDAKDCGMANYDRQGCERHCHWDKGARVLH